jgi:ATP-dependent DNA ligase
MEAIAPMEALLADRLPEGAGWQFEPKWDGFRCIAVRDGKEVALWSKSGKPLGRYFPDIVKLAMRLKAKRFVLDGELVIVSGGLMSFDALQLRLHPAASRVSKLAEASPASFIAFDCLAIGSTMLAGKSLAERRAALEKLLAGEDDPHLLLSPVTDDREKALDWLKRSGGALDGVIAKRLDDAYRPSERAMVKVKPKRTADCVVGGFRYASNSNQVGSLLLGLYDDAGLLHHVGFTSSLAKADRVSWTERLEPLIEAPGFTGDAPGGPSRWSTTRSADWQPLLPQIVIEVAYDQVTGGRFRHGTKLVRERPDKAPSQCRCDQLSPPLTPAQLRQLTR